MKKAFFLSLAMISLVCFLNAQNQDWMLYNIDGNLVEDLEDDGNFLWAGTHGGLVNFDKSTGIKTYFNILNSGLPENWISSLALDESGAKWIGTGTWWGGFISGLTKFDGTNWINYNTSNSAIPNDYITTIAAANNGILWIGCAGLTKFDGTTWTNYNTSNSELPNDIVNSIDIEDNGIIWVATKGGLVAIDDTNWTVYDTTNSEIPYYSVVDVAIDPNGDKWVSTHAPYYYALSKFDGINWIDYTLPLGAGIISITFDTNGVLWGRSWGSEYAPSGRLVRFDGTEWTVYTASNSGLPFNSVQDVVIDGIGTKWMGTLYFGLVEFDDINWMTYNISNSSLPSNDIKAIAIDEEGAKWVGAYSMHFYNGDHIPGGLVLFDEDSWTNYNTSNSGLPYELVLTLTIDGNGNVWIANHGSNNGKGALVKFDGTNWTIFDTLNSDLPNGEIHSIVIDGSGIKWIGTYNGLAKFDDTNWTVYDTSNSDLPSNNVGPISIDGSGCKWIGTLNGLAKFDDTIWTVYDTSNSDLPANIITSIAIDLDGTKWIGAANWDDGRGLAAFDGSNWTVYDESNSGLPDNLVNAIAIDNNGTKWIGTGDYSGDGGLAAFDGTDWAVYNTSNSVLPSNFIQAIAIDNNGTKWIGTGVYFPGYGGLVAFNEEGIPVLIDENVKTNQLVNVYPNPSDDILNIELLSKTDISYIEIINIQGLIIKRQRISNSKKAIDMSELSAGIYIIRVYTEKGVAMKKIIKQ